MPPPHSSPIASEPLRPLDTPEALLARAQWFSGLARALADGHLRAAPLPSAASDAGRALEELRLQSRLLAEIRALPADDRDAIVQRYFGRKSRRFFLAPSTVRLERSARQAITQLRSRLDVAFGSRSAWLAELPDWALVSRERSLEARQRMPLLPDTASRVLVGVVGVAGIAVVVWISKPTWAWVRSSPADSMPMLPLVPHNQAPCVLEGDLDLGDWIQKSWSVGLAHASHEHAPFAHGHMEQGGRFQLATSARGPFVLVFRTVPDGTASHRIEIPVSLSAGRQELDVRVPMRRLRLIAATKPDQDLLHVCHGPANRTFWTRFHAEKLTPGCDLVVPEGKASMRFLPKGEPWPRSLEDVAGLPDAEVTTTSEF